MDGVNFGCWIGNKCMEPMRFSHEKWGKVFSPLEALPFFLIQVTVRVGEAALLVLIAIPVYGMALVGFGLTSYFSSKVTGNPVDETQPRGFSLLSDDIIPLIGSFFIGNDSLDVKSWNSLRSISRRYLRVCNARTPELIAYRENVLRIPLSNVLRIPLSNVNVFARIWVWILRYDKQSRDQMQVIGEISFPGTRFLYPKWFKGELGSIWAQYQLYKELKIDEMGDIEYFIRLLPGSVIAFGSIPEICRPTIEGLEVAEIENMQKGPIIRVEVQGGPTYIVVVLQEKGKPDTKFLLKMGRTGNLANRVWGEENTLRWSEDGAYLAYLIGGDLDADGRHLEKLAHYKNLEVANPVIAEASLVN